MELNGIHVIVVGGATGGSAAALLLARAGARVTLFEKVENLRPVGAGIALAANGLAVLESVGLGPALDKTAITLGAARVVDARGRILLTPAEPRPRLAMLRRASLQGMLLDAIAAHPDIEMYSGTEVVDAAPDGKIVARNAAGEIHLQADLVVGADGVHSRVRECGRFGANVSPPGITYIRALAPEGLARTEEAWTSAGLFGSLPVDGATYLYASAGSPPCREAVANHDLNAFRAAWTRAYPPARQLLGPLHHWSDLIVNRVIRVKCDRWYDGKLVLLGDAAHAMPPNLGQGANSALVDAAILLTELRQAVDIPSALSAYDARRRPAVQKVAYMSARLGALAELTHPAARWVRDNLLLPAASRFASSKTNDTVMQEKPEMLRTIA